ncbi:MAG: hypothetical protein J4F35_14365 [Candidatus Latescibacteria bacterium]|nr:hypothetical protein [Candidatus Latescibacterota bacterium]
MRSSKDALLVDIGRNADETRFSPEHVQAGEGAFEQADDALGRLVQFDAATAEVGDRHAFCESRSVGEQESE